MSSCFFFNDTATTEIYTFPYTTLFRSRGEVEDPWSTRRRGAGGATGSGAHRCGPRHGESRRVGGRRLRAVRGRSEEHTSELQSRQYLVCRLLLEKKKKTSSFHIYNV